MNRAPYAESGLDRSGDRFFCIQLPSPERFVPRSRQLLVTSFHSEFRCLASQRSTNNRTPPNGFFQSGGEISGTAGGYAKSDRSGNGSPRPNDRETLSSTPSPPGKTGGEGNSFKNSFHWLCRRSLTNLKSGTGNLKSSGTRRRHPRRIQTVPEITRRQ